VIGRFSGNLSEAGAAATWAFAKALERAFMSRR
jgi:hypothetical protein